MKRETNYNRLIRDDIELVKKKFASIGKQVKTEDDFGTYDLWKERGRRVKRGETALHIESSKPYPIPVYSYGAPVLNENGEKKFRKYHQHWCLFSKDQTEEI
jgi:hypothetical protein